MKKLFYLFLSFTLFISGIHAQNCSDVIATATATPSTCQSNGSIIITLSGASVDKLVEKRYSIKSTTGTIAYGPVSTNVFQNLPPGTYNLEAAGYCNSLEGEAVVRTVNNVVVTGSYQDPRLTFIAQSYKSNTPAILTSRKSYANCSTGLIVLLFENGNQTSMPTFTITSAPAGVTVPQTVGTTKATNGTAATGWRYLLEGTWPAGTYTVSASDGCYNATTSFVIEEITTVPSGSFGYYFYPYGDGTDCSKIYYLPYYSYSSSSSPETYLPDWNRYFNDGLYEYGIAPNGEMPKEQNWFRVRDFSGSGSTTYSDLFDLSPAKITDYFTLNALKIYTRVKNCPSAITSFYTTIQKNANLTYRDDACTGVRNYSFYYSKLYQNYCYPLTFTITDKLTGETKYSNSNYLYTDPNFSWVCNPGDSQYLNITDANEYKIQTNYALIGGTPSSTAPAINIYTITSYPEHTNCDSYKRVYYTTTGTPCGDQSAFPCYVNITDGDGTVIRSDTLTSSTNKTIDNLQYGVNYKLTYTYPNWNNISSSQSWNLKRADNIPNAFTMSKYTTSVCRENTGQLMINTGSRARSFKAATTITITGPTGYAGQSYTFPSNIDGSSYYLPETYLPPGVYTATIVSCGETFSASLTVAGNKADNLSYIRVQDCFGVNIFPSGSISYNGVPLSTVYFRLTSAPSGVNVTKVISSKTNDSFLFTTAGTYVLGMMTANSSTACAIMLDTIYHNPQSVGLDLDKTSAYSCPGAQNGYLTIQAKNGVPPYTYTVYDKTNTNLLYGPVTSDKEIDLGNFGIAKETYVVRIKDACNSNIEAFNQSAELVSLDEAALAYGQAKVCYGTPIQVNGFTVTDATYKWTGPNGFTSTEKNPIIPNAKPRDAGWYYVEIDCKACNIIKKDSINITVYDPVIPEVLNGITQEVTLCPYQALTIGQAATGGSGGVTYQWQYNSNSLGTGIWTNIPGQTNAIFTTTSTAYIFTGTTANPSYRYLRLVITDASCGTFYLNYHTNVRACMFLVNPNLRSPASSKTVNQIR